MKLLSFFPFLLTSWTMIVFSYESYMDNTLIDSIVYFLTAVVLLYYGVQRSNKKPKDRGRLIALNIGLLPLLYANLLLLPLMFKGSPINESGMVYVLVLIYGPIFYIGALVVMEVLKMFMKGKS